MANPWYSITTIAGALGAVSAAAATQTTGTAQLICLLIAGALSGILGVTHTGRT